VVAGVLSRVLEGTLCESPEMTCVALLESMPLVYSSIKENQKSDSFCKELSQKILAGQAEVDNFHIQSNLVCFFPKKNKRRIWVVPVITRPMLLSYVHDSPLAEHLVVHSTFHKIAVNLWWPKMRSEIFQYARKYSLCQGAKPAQNARVEWHTAKHSTQHMEKFFVDIVDPLTRTKRGISAILVAFDGFSKFVCFFPVRRISSQEVIYCLERNYFAAYGTSSAIVTDNAIVFRSKQVKYLCFRWGVNHFTTIPYYPQGSLDERVNRNTKSALSSSIPKSLG